MNDSNEIFFVSESLKGILDKEDLSTNAELPKKDFEEADLQNFEKLSGKVFILDLQNNILEIEISMKMAKMLIDNKDKLITADFLDTSWVLSTTGIKLQVISEGKLKASLSIVNERKEDTYGRPI